MCVPDHSVETEGDWNGRTILLVPEFSEYHCLKAYRDGHFYGCLKDNGLTITNVSLDDSLLSVEVNEKSHISFITSNGIEKETDARSAQFSIAADTIYVRVEVHDGSGERLFLQAIMNQ